jgi:hypothetical protein
MVSKGEYGKVRIENNNLLPRIWCTHLQEIHLVARSSLLSPKT